MANLQNSIFGWCWKEIQLFEESLIGCFGPTFELLKRH